MFECEKSECYPIELNVQPDHIHLIVDIPPKLSISEVVRKLKFQTNRLAQFHLFKILKDYNVEGSIWSNGYFASTVGIDSETIKNYVKNQ